jgi:prophage maintenance system killer protein
LLLLYKHTLVDNLENKIEIYKSPDGQTEVQVQLIQDTIWLSQRQMADLFDKDVRTINEHIQTVFNTGELDEKATIRKFRIVQTEGARNIARNIDHFSLDMIISVGYRVNSIRGTQFRQWATQRLKDYLIEGLAINETRLAQKNKEIQVLHDGIKILSRVIEEKANAKEFEWLHQFSLGLKLLDDYDHEALDRIGKHTTKAKYPTLKEYMELVKQMKMDFNSDIFGKEKDGGFKSAVTLIQQQFGKKDIYLSIEEKASMLLYLVVKNHAFVDGNKRIAAACFLLFLNRNNLLYNEQGQTIISNEALASLTLFVASSKAEEMETIKQLLVSILNRNMLKKRGN